MVESKGGVCTRHGGTWVSGTKNKASLFISALIFILYFISTIGIITVVHIYNFYTKIGNMYTHIGDMYLNFCCWEFIKTLRNHWFI